jgi:hypothetical protein
MDMLLRIHWLLTGTANCLSGAMESLTSRPLAGPDLLIHASANANAIFFTPPYPNHNAQLQRKTTHHFSVTVSSHCDVIIVFYW